MPPTEQNQSHGQRGSLNLMRYPGQSILIYPKPRMSSVSAGELFVEPIEIIVDSVGPQDDVHSRIVADKRLVVVRNEIYRRNGNAFSPDPALREEAFRRAFFELARACLGSGLFEELSRQAWQRVLDPARAELTD